MLLFDIMFIQQVSQRSRAYELASVTPCASLFADREGFPEAADRLPKQEEASVDDQDSEDSSPCPQRRLGLQNAEGGLS